LRCHGVNVARRPVRRRSRRPPVPGGSALHCAGGRPTLGYPVRRASSGFLLLRNAVASHGRARDAV